MTENEEIELRKAALLAATESLKFKPWNDILVESQRIYNWLVSKINS